MVLIPRSKNMAKSIVGFPKNPAILFAMFLQGSTSQQSIWRGYGANACPCFETVTKSWCFLPVRNAIKTTPIFNLPGGTNRLPSPTRINLSVHPSVCPSVYTCLQIRYLAENGTGPTDVVNYSLKS
jgi:hypothetical protein